jgi:Tol biopolymer transport system component
VEPHLLWRGRVRRLVHRNPGVARASEAQVDQRIVLADREGNLQPAFPAPSGWTGPARSPDGRWLALSRVDESDIQLWLYDTTRQVLSQLTRFTDGVSFGPVGMPDGRSVLFSREVPQYDIWRQPIDGSTATPVVETSSTSGSRRCPRMDATSFTAKRFRRRC